MNIGLSSILLIFVVLCLVSFSILSIVSANADKKLSQKVMNRSIAYYNACNEAETMLRDVNEQLHALYSNASDDSVYLATVSTLDQTYHYTISDLQELEVVLNYPVPDSDKAPFYEIVSWKVMNLQDTTYDEQLHVIP